MAGPLRKTSDWFLDVLLQAQSQWDQKYSGNILDMPFERQLAHYLNHYAKYSNHDNFKVFMRSKTEHKVKSDMVIITLCLLNQCYGNIPTPRDYPELNTYNKLLEKIFWTKDEYDHTNKQEKLTDLYGLVRTLYDKMMKDYGLLVLDWVDNRRRDYESLKPLRSNKRNKKNESDES